MQQVEVIRVWLHWGSERCTSCRVWAAWTQNRVRRVMSVGLRRGHMCIQEALHLVPLDLRLYPQGSGSLLPIHLLILQPDPLVQKSSPWTQAILCPENLTLGFLVPGPKPPAGRGLRGRTVSSCRGPVLLPVFPELCEFGGFFPFSDLSCFPQHPLLCSLSQTQFLLLRTTGISSDTGVTVELHQPHIELSGVQL